MVLKAIYIPCFILQFVGCTLIYITMGIHCKRKIKVMFLYFPRINKKVMKTLYIAQTHIQIPRAKSTNAIHLTQYRNLLAFGIQLVIREYLHHTKLLTHTVQTEVRNQPYCFAAMPIQSSTQHRTYGRPHIVRGIHPTCNGHNVA